MFKERFFKGGLIIVVLIILFGILNSFVLAVNPPGVPHSFVGKLIYYNYSLADGVNLTMFYKPGTPSQEKWLETYMGNGDFGSEFFELNLGNVNSSLVWASASGANLSLSNDLKWATGDEVLIVAKRHRPDGLVQTAQFKLRINATQNGYQLVPNITLNELPSVPGLSDLDSKFSPEPNAIFVRKPKFNWTSSTDVADGTNVKSISANIRYQLQISNKSDMSYLIINTTVDDLNNLKIDNVSMSPYTNDFLVGTYYYRIRAYDGIDYGPWSSIKSFVVKPVNVTLKLKKGYNLVSFPDILEILNTGQEFEQVSAQQFLDLFPSPDYVQSITRWDASGQVYPLPVCAKVLPFPPYYVGCDFNITLGEGFYVEMIRPYNLSYAGKPIETVNYSLKPGYNLVGYNNRLGNITALDYINQFPPDTIQSITRWDPVQQVYPLPVCAKVLPFPPYYVGCDFNLSNGEAYFIESNSNVEINFTFVDDNN